MKTALILAVVCILLIAVVPARRAAAQQDDVARLLEILSNAPGPSGFEEPVRKIMAEQMKPYADKLSFDGMGNVIATQGSTGPRVMIDAHMDELGGMIRRITPTGFLSMQMLGGWFDQALVDQRWIILGSKGPVIALTGMRDIHVAAPEERTRVFPREGIYLDIGAKNADEVKAMGIEPGDPVVPDSKFEVMNGSQNYLGKAWDDRIGCAVIVEVMKRLAHSTHPNQVFYAATTQEEVGLRGAHTAVETIRPDIGIALEAGVTGDTPANHPEESQVKLGSGPGHFLYDASELPNRKFAAFIQATARSASIPLQYDLVTGYGDDSAEIQKWGTGTPAVNIVVPTRYTHSHNGIINRGDFDRTVDLIVALVEKLDSDTVAKIRDFTPR